MRSRRIDKEAEVTIYLLAAIALFCLVVGVATDLRRFSNAVFLGLFLGLLGIALVDALVRASSGSLVMPLTSMFLAIPGAAALLLVSYLIHNGVIMVRREGRRAANLLSLFAGIGILVVMGLLVLAVTTGVRLLAIITGLMVVTIVYFGFLLSCFVLYGSLYGRLKVRGSLDYVVVLGSGLIGGDRVPPLLASRLERARKVLEEQVEQGHAPLLITSGGQGSDERVSEAHAMAAYLMERGLSSAGIVEEDRSRTTEENLRNSRNIMDRARPDYRCVIVTSDFHAYRSALIARETGVRGQVLGSPTATYFRPSATLREFAAVILSNKIVNAAACLLLAQQCWTTIW